MTFSILKIHFNLSFQAKQTFKMAQTFSAPQNFIKEIGLFTGFGPLIKNIESIQICGWSGWQCGFCGDEFRSENETEEHIKSECTYNNSGS